MDYNFVLDNFEFFEETLTPEKVQEIILLWGLECRNTYSDVKTVEEKEQNMRLYLVK